MNTPHIPPKKKDFISIEIQIILSMVCTIIIGIMELKDSLWEHRVTSLGLFELVCIFFGGLLGLFELNSILKGRKPGERGLLFMILTRFTSYALMVILFFHFFLFGDDSFLNFWEVCIVLGISLYLRTLTVVPEDKIGRVYRNGKLYRTIGYKRLFAAPICHIVPFLESVFFEEISDEEYLELRLHPSIFHKFPKKNLSLVSQNIRFHITTSQVFLEITLFYAHSQGTKISKADLEQESRKIMSKILDQYTKEHPSTVPIQSTLFQEYLLDNKPDIDVQFNALFESKLCSYYSFSSSIIPPQSK